MNNYLKTALSLTVVAVSATTFAQNAVTVNGKAISSAMVDFLAKQQETQGKPLNAEQRKVMIDRLVEMEVLSQDATNKRLPTADLEAELAFTKMRAQAQNALRNFQEKNLVTDAQAKVEYEKQAKDMGGKEYRARHILVDDEAQAKDLIAKLKIDGKFEDLVKVSKDTGSAAQGGDLGFTNPASFVKPFADAMVALKKGELTATPVKSEFGFHVIELTDVRDATPPAFDDVKAQIKEGMAQERLQAYIDGLRKKAVVK